MPRAAAKGIRLITVASNCNNALWLDESDGLPDLALETCVYNESHVLAFTFFLVSGDCRDGQDFQNDQSRVIGSVD